MSMLNYFFETNCGLALIAIVYNLLLRNETAFTFMRAYLLLGIVASLVFPLIHSSLPFLNSNPLPIFSNWIAVKTMPELIIGTTNATFVTFYELSLGAYFLVYIILAVLLVYRLIGVFRILRTNNLTRYSDYSVIESEEQGGSFSFFRTIFIGNVSQFTPEDKKNIILHEQAHIRLLHSLDILLMEIIKLFFWFNPAVYILKRNLKDIHEYQADSMACTEGDRDSYCMLMVRMALLSVKFPIANYFNQSQTLKRITMINAFKTNLSKVRLGSIVSISLIFFTIIACQDQLKNQTNENEAPSVEVELSSSDEVFIKVDQPAAPSEGIEGFYDQLATHLRYPEQARQMGIEGKVFVEFTVNKDGSLSDIHAIKGIGAGCDSEAVRAIAMSGNWNPGKFQGKIVRMKMVLPITFKLG